MYPFSPILIIGAARTGTTWLSNILANNFNLFTLKSDLHYGVKEPQLFQLNRYYYRLKNKQVFVEEMKHSDIFYLLEVANKQVHLHNYLDFFFDHMDRLSVQHGKPWFIKLCPEFFYTKDEFIRIKEYLYNRYPGVKSIIIERDLDDYLDSYINMPGRNTNTRRKWYFVFFALLLAISRFKVQYLRARALHSPLIITYEQLLTSKDVVMDKISDQLNLPQVDYADSSPNSSSKVYELPRMLKWFILLITKSMVICHFVLRVHMWLTGFRRPEIYTRHYDLTHNTHKLGADLKARGEDLLWARITKEYHLTNSHE